MKYRDLIHFDPPQKVVQLRHSEDAAVGRELVATYVISPQMAERLTATVVPNLQYDNPKDNKALLIVGNYGTGKSHLLSLIATLAEHADVAPALRDDSVRKAAGSIAGRFKVMRLEIGATTMALRDFLCDALQNWLQEEGIDFTFKPMSEVWENKKELGRMMAAFHSRFPDHGLLLVVDEMLDYLRSRNAQALTLDLGFLREIGEVCRDLRLRFIAGLQESLFDSPQFQFAADSLRRVKDRFDQVRIARDDLAYVVQERLLRKTPEQKALVRQHLAKFTHLFGAMQEKLDTYVGLYPVHPAYLEVFERVRVGEKRQALASLATAMQALLDTEVPPDQPGLIAYDGYWREIKDNAGFRADPGIGKVIRCAETIEARVTSGFATGALKRLIPPATRIIHGLAVQRLTDGDITAPIGVTAEQLRDELALAIPGAPIPNAQILKTTVETILREIMKTVAGQFISVNADNGQYYLDIQKDIDFDTQVDAKAETLGPDVLDRYYFNALASVMDCTGETYVTGYQIWEHEVEWREHRAGRPGYLFFGAPNQRSTAQPPREFYLYFIQPFFPPKYEDEQKPDEVFFKLARRDEKFEQALKLYAAASELAHSAGGYRSKYEEKAGSHLKVVLAWLRESLPTVCDVTYQGTSKKLVEWSRAGTTAKGTIREMINGVGSACLGQQFQDRAPEYPKFPALIMRDSRRQAATEAVAWLAGNKKGSALGRAMLDGLEMLDGEQLRVLDHKEPSRGSRYATFVYGELAKKGQGQVLNRSELIASEFNGQIQYDHRFRLEPELFVVVLAALVAAENVSLALPGKKYDAATLADLAKVPVLDIAEFKHLERPKDFDIGALRELFKLVGLTEGLALSLAQGGAGDAQAALQQLLDRVTEWIGRSLGARQAVTGGLVLWDTAMLSDAERDEYVTTLDGFKTFLDAITLYNTPARFKNFKFTASEVAAQHVGVDRVRQVDDLVKLIGQLAPKISYLQTAKSALPEEHAWVGRYDDARGELIVGLQSPRERRSGEFQRALGERLEGLKQEWRQVYEAFHARHRLNKRDDERKAKLLHQDSRLAQLRKLCDITHIPSGHLDALTNAVAGLKTCWTLVPEDLATAPLCPHCHFQPRNEHNNAAAREWLDGYDGQIDSLLKTWTEKLLTELEDPVVQEERLPLLTPDHQKRIRAFLAERVLPSPVDNGFVQAVNEALADLVRVVLSPKTLLATFAGGALTVDKFRSQFEHLLGDLVKGKDQKKVRIVLE